MILSSFLVQKCQDGLDVDIKDRLCQRGGLAGAEAVWPPLAPGLYKWQPGPVQAHSSSAQAAWVTFTRPAIITRDKQMGTVKHKVLWTESDS